MKKVAVFGATGPAGIGTIKAALQKGMKVQALVRDMSRFPQEFQGKISVVEGNVLNLEDVRKTINGVDAVIVCLGTRHTSGFDATTDLSDGMKNIVVAMKENNITVVAICLSVYMLMDEVPQDVQELQNEHVRMHEVVKQAGLQWIVSAAPWFTEDPPTGYKVKNGGGFGELREPIKELVEKVSMYDLGQFFVDCISMPEHYRQIVGIASK